MIKTTGMLLDELQDYSAPANKLQRMVKTGELTPIVRGLYETDRDVSAHLLAGSIYGPSYISFEFALSAHGLIPEAVRVVTCATFEKNKTKHYNTPFGRFTYRDIPSAAFPYGIEVLAEGAYSYRMATAEKALCDKLYTMPPTANYAELEDLLFANLRIDSTIFAALDPNFITDVAGLYRSTNVTRLAKYIKRRTAQQV